MVMYLLIVNMGTLLSVKELIAQWKTIVISLSGILGIIVILFGIGSLIFDMHTVIVAIPPLVGGLVSALIMSEGAAEAGLTFICFCNCYLCYARVCWLSIHINCVEKRRKKTFRTISKW